MTDFIPLSRLMKEGRPDDYLVSLQKGRKINFATFRSDVSAAADAFKAYKIGALATFDSYLFAVGFFGLLYAGVRIIVPQNMQPGTLEALAGQCDIIIDDAWFQTMKPSSAPLTELDANRQDLDFFTSGTTGKPNCIRKSLSMLECEVETLETLWGDDVGKGLTFATVSHQHIYGLTFKLLWPLAAGRPFVAEMHSLWEPLFAQLTPQAVIISSPAHLGRLGGMDALSSSQSPKKIFSAGAPLSFIDSKMVASIFGCQPTEIFGSTETGAIATRQVLSDDEEWKPLPGIEIRAEQGRLALRSPFVSPSWVKTPDLIECTSSGFRFCGRSDRIAKIEGKRVSLPEIEEALCALSQIREAAVLVLEGAPDLLCALIVPSEEGLITLSNIGKFRFERLLRKSLTWSQEAASIPRLWRFIDALPMGPMGKRRDADILPLFKEEK